MRYEVRRYNLEEFLEENRMVYLPCDSIEEAKREYAKELELYNDCNHIVELCEVEYTLWGERVRVMASSENEDPYRVILKEDTIQRPSEEEADEDDEGCVDPAFAYATGQGPCPWGDDD